MPVFKVSYTCQASTPRRTGGWSENFYLTKDTTTEALDTISEFVDLRCAMLPTTAKITALHAVNVSTPGPVGVREVDRGGFALTLTDIPQMALKVIARAAGGYHRTIEFVCIPDARVVSGEYSPTPVFSLALYRVTQFIKNNSFQMRCQDRTKPKYDLVSISSSGVFSLQSAATFDVLTKFKLLRVKDQYGRAIKGNFVVSAKDSSTAGTFANWPTGLTVTKGKIREVAIVYVEITDYKVPYKIGTRKVGKPSDLYVGRLSRRS